MSVTGAGRSREWFSYKRKLNDMNKEFQSLKSKVASQKDYNEAAAPVLPTTQDVQFLSDSSVGGVTPSYELYRYVRPQRVWFFSRFGHK